MSADPGQDEQPALAQAADDRYHVDARNAQAVQVGDDGTQINYFYNGTWTDGVAPPPLAETSGKITSPYRGLRAFGVRDAAWFFGREAAATKVLELMSGRLRGPGLLVVSGVSGAGKSSLLRAGVLPRLRGAGLASAHEAAWWPCLVFTPSSKPLDELAVRVAGMVGAVPAVLRQGLAADPAGFALTARQAALASPDVPGQEADAEEAGEPGRRLLIIVDQCEQLFTRCEEADRQAFITALYAAATVGHGGDQLPAAVVVLAIRADFEARLAEYRPAEFPLLAPAVQDRYLLTSMTGRQLRMAITEPAAKAGSSVDDDLVRVLLEEMRTGSPADGSGGPAGAAIGAGVLPLLSHALDQSWRRRTGHALTLADYERTGGIQGAVAASAQDAYDRLTAAQQDIARQVFIRLTATTADGLDTIARVARADLTAGLDQAPAADVAAVLETFAGERLLTLAADTVEISHEALLTAWPLLRDTWLADTHADRMIRTRLHATAEEWTHAVRDPSYLYGGSRLEAASEAATRIGTDARHTPLSQDERDFLHASRRAVRRGARRRQGLIALLLVLVAGLAAVAVAAVRANQNSSRQRDIAISGQLAGDSEAIGEVNATTAQYESLAAWGASHTASAQYAMADAAASPELATISGVATISGGSGVVESVAFSPDGKILATGDDDGTVRLWNVATGRLIRIDVDGRNDSVYSVAFSPDGKILATGDNNGWLRLWSSVTGRQIRHMYAGGSEGSSVNAVAFGPDGKTLATGNLLDGTARLWNVTTGRQIADLPTGSGQIYSLAFSPDGSKLAAADGRGSVQLWDIATRRVIRVFPAEGGSTTDLSVAFSSVGTMLATGGAGGTWIWDVATGRAIHRVTTGSGSPVRVTFSPDGKTLATGSSDGTQLWNVTTGQPTDNFPTGSQPGSVESLAFSPDGKTLATGDSDGTARLWNLAAGVPAESFPATGSGAAGSVAFGPDGKTLATGGSDGGVRLWNVTTGQQARSFPLQRPVQSVAFNPKDTTLAAGGYSGTAVWNTSTGRQLDRMPIIGKGVWITSVAFSPDGTTLATGDDIGDVRLWNVTTGRQIRSFRASSSVNALAFSPDGTTLATGDNDGTARLWNVTTGRQIRAYGTNSTSVQSVAFSPDGSTLAGGDLSGTAWVWNVTTGQQIDSFPTGSAVVPAVAFSPDGTTLATGDDDGTVRLWNLAAGKQVGNPITTGTVSVDSVAFSPDGTTLASAAGGTAQLWNVGYLHDPLARLCAQVGGTFTHAEWRQYVPSGPAYRNVCAGTS